MSDAPAGLDIRMAQVDEIPGCSDILRSLPDWFGIESAIDAYARAIPSLPTLVATRGGAVVGFLTLKFHGDESAEVYLLAVRHECHRQGIGSALLERAEQRVRERGCELLQVKTLGPSHPSPEYAGTRRFYRAKGFVPLEELHDIWPGNPCLIMVKHLGSPTGSGES